MKTIKLILKIIAEGIVAIAILSLLLCFYYLTPVHVENPNGNTDYVWQANSVWIKQTEGIAWGQFDSNGFNNPKVIENPDIIIVGSSHMEATEVFNDQNVCSRLNEKFDEKYSVYNLGISGHDFFKTCQYLPRNLELPGNPPKIAIIETSTVDITQDKVNAVLNGEIEKTASQNNGVVKTLLKIPFLRTLYYQLDGGLLDILMGETNSSNNITEENAEEEAPDSKIIDAGYEKIFDYLANLEKQYGTQIVIFYHPTGKLQEDGSISFDTGEGLLKFAYYSDSYGIDFIDMTDDFEYMYYSEHLVPHGFVTGALCKGHLNANGHAVIADALYDKIEDMEKRGLICR